MNTKMIKIYSDMMKLTTFIDRFEYLKLDGKVGYETFGYDRYLNQMLYHTSEWKRLRREVILRDNGCDLGCSDRIIYGKILVHHINPISIEDVLNRRRAVFDLNNVICVSMSTHNAIHYGDISLLITDPIERTKNDTCPWKK